MAELNDNLDWEEGMCLCEESVTNSVMNSNYGLNTNRYKITDSITYTIFLISNQKDRKNAEKDQTPQKMKEYPKDSKIR